MARSFLTVFGHSDDETFSAGGTLALMSEKGWETHAVCTIGNDDRADEFRHAAEILGLKSAINLDLDLHTNPLAARRALEDQILRTRPEVLITHYFDDYHLDHRLTRAVALEAVEWASHVTSHGDKAHMVQRVYEAETTVLLPDPTHLVDITPVVGKKLEAVSAYSSQSQKGGTGFYGDFALKRAEMRGVQAGSQYAEGFNLVPHRVNHPFASVRSSTEL